jgi:very-short-patch-repair endonuclease
MLQGPKSTIKRARKLRKEMSLSEMLLWRELRKRPGGLKFRKQHPAGPFVADFFCHEARLVIEVDGEAHERGDRPARDMARDRWFAERRFEVMRVPAYEVLGDLEGAVRWIAARAEALIPLHHLPAAGGPTPLPGEGLR